MSIRGIVSGALLLILLETIVRNDVNAGRFGSVFTLAASGVQWLVSADVPGVPDLRAAGAGDLATADAGAAPATPGGGGGGGGGSSW